MSAGDGRLAALRGYDVKYLPPYSGEVSGGQQAAHEADKDILELPKRVAEQCIAQHGGPEHA